MPIPENEKVIVKPACECCGQPYLKGSETTCSQCLRRASDPCGRRPTLIRSGLACKDRNRRSQERLRCDCGELAAAVILVKITIGGATSLEPLVVCEECLKIEMEMVRGNLCILFNTKVTKSTKGTKYYLIKNQCRRG